MNRFIIPNALWEHFNNTYKYKIAHKMINPSSIYNEKFLAYSWTLLGQLGRPNSECLFYGMMRVATPAYRRSLLIQTRWF